MFYYKKSFQNILEINENIQNSEGLQVIRVLAAIFVRSLSSVQDEKCFGYFTNMRINHHFLNLFTLLGKASIY